MLLASDSETVLFQPGYAVPRPICWSFKYRKPDAKAFLDYPGEGCDRLEAELDAGTILVYHHAPFDLTVAAEYRPSLLTKIFKAYRDGRIRDTKSRAQLIDIRIGRRKNPASKKKEAWRGDPWPESTPGYGTWIAPDYTLAGNPERGTHGLVGLFFGRDRSAQKGGPDAWRTRYAELEHLPFGQWPEAARSYAEDDASDTLDVYEAQFELAKRAGGLLTADDIEAPLVDEVRQCRASFVLKLISSWGVRTNAKTLDALEAACLRVRNDIRTKLMEQNLFRYEGPKKEPKRKIVKNTKVIQERVKTAFEAMGLEVPRTDPTDRCPEGNVKTDKDTLVLSGDPFLEELAEAGPASTVLQTFIPALRGGVDVPLNTRYDEMLDNGRISSSAPNLANLPRGETLIPLLGMDVRQAVEPRPGNLLCSVDLDCAELRSGAQVDVWLAQEFNWPFPDMAKFFQDNPNGDPHLELAADMLNIDPVEAKRRKAAGDKEIKHYRQSCKPTNFGLPGGMGPPKLVESARKSYGVKMTLQEGRQMRAAWKRRWREKGRYLDYISHKTQSPWDVKQFVSNRIRGRCGYSDAANTLWSGLTADATKHALWEVAQRCYLPEFESPLYGCRIVLFLYDELIIECPEDIAHEAAHELTAVIIAAVSEFTPDIPCTCAPALMRRWYKGAEAVYDADGRLVPWEPRPSAT